MSPEIRPQIEVSTASGNFFDKSHPWPFSWTVGKFVKVAEDCGYSGLEWHPVRGLGSFLLSHGLVSSHSKEAITSLHQSFRGEKSLKEAWRHENRQLAVLSYLTLPQTIDSLDCLEQFQKVVGRKLPVVLYPSLPNEESGTDRSFGEKLFQPTPEVMEMWGAKTTQELIDEGYRRGYTGICLDLFHFRETAEFDLNPWQESLPKLLPHTKEIHVSAGRSEITVAHNVDTNAELEDLVKGDHKTDLSKMLGEVRNFGWRGYVVTEVPAASLKEQSTDSGFRLKTQDLVACHRQIAETVKGILA